MHWKMLFQNALNGTYKDYYYSIPLEKGKSKRVFNQEFTTLIHKKIDAINRDFKKWLLQDPQKNIAEELTNRYYLLNNAFVEKEYNVDFMTLPKMKNFIPYEHQKEAALKFITNEGGILDHKVGFGKTATMGLTNQKLKMMGKPNKTLLCCLNANYEKVYAEIREIFPEAKMLLIPSRKELTKNDALLQKITNEHWDFVVLPHTFLNAIPKDLEIQLDILKEKMAQLDAVITSENELKDKTMNAQQLDFFLLF